MIMPVRARHAALAIVLAITLASSCARAADARDSILPDNSVQDDLRHELNQRGLQVVIPVLEDNGVTSLDTFAALEEEDFSDMQLKLGHRRKLVNWWRLFVNSKSDIRRKAQKSAVEHKSQKTRAWLQWGAHEYARCEQPYSWKELSAMYKNGSRIFKTGGLGRLLEEDGYESWLCLRDHYCARDSGDYFCWVYHESYEVFTPWGENSLLELVPTLAGDAGGDSDALAKRVESLEEEVMRLQMCKCIRTTIVDTVTPNFSPAVGGELITVTGSNFGFDPPEVCGSPMSCNGMTCKNVARSCGGGDSACAASQSSPPPNSNGGVPGRAVDGNTDGNWGGGSCTNTEDHTNDAWWQVDFGASRNIIMVEVHNRIDCCGGFLDNWQVRLGDHPELQHNPVCSTGNGVPAPSVQIPCKGRGRYLSIQVVGSHMRLTLCEVYAWGPLPGWDWASECQPPDLVAQIGDTPSPRTLWVDDSTILVEVPPGVGKGLNVSVGSDEQFGTAVALFSYSPPEVRGPIPIRGPTTGNFDVAIWGVNFGTNDYGIIAHVGASLAADTVWLSDSSVVVRVPAAVSAQDTDLLLRLAGSVSVSPFVYDAPFFLNASEVLYPTMAPPGQYLGPSPHAADKTRRLTRYPEAPSYAAGARTLTQISMAIQGCNRKWYRGGVVGPDGLIYLVPGQGSAESACIGVVNPDTGTATGIDISSIVASTMNDWPDNMYSGGVLGPDGLIYFVPRYIRNIGVLDTTTWNFTIITGDDIGSGYQGGVLGPDGLIYMAGTEIGVLDPVAKTVAKISNPSGIHPGRGKPRGAVLGPDGLIYFVPYDCDADCSIKVLDPATQTLDFIDIPVGARYWGGVLGPDGNIYLVPHDADNIGVLDPFTRNFTTIDILEGDQHADEPWKFAGGVLGPDGYIYLAPFSSNVVQVLDPVTQNLAKIDASFVRSHGQKYAGGVLGPNNKVYFVPYWAWDLGELGGLFPLPVYQVDGGMPEAWRARISPHFNKY